MSDTKKSDELTVTKKMLDETRNELKSDNASLKLEMKSGFGRLDSKIDELSSKMEQVLSAVHNTKALVEEQDNRNKYVMDGHQNLHDRQERFEKEIRDEVSQVKTVISKMNTTN